LRGSFLSACAIELEPSLTLIDRTPSFPPLLQRKVVIWKSWCGACKSLRPRFAESEAIQQLADKFVMVNTVDDEEPTDEKYKKDGSYIPRIYFADSNGEVFSDVVNSGGNPQYAFYHSEPDSIAKSMATVADRVASSKSAQEL
jgi:protein-disulfide reductase (glutathione)